MDQAIGYQIFSDNPDPTVGAPRVALLRAELARHGLDGFIIPRADEHQGEYVPARAERLKWLTGFGGSAGMAIVLKDKAAIFIDGRYTLQVRDQVDMNVFEPQHLVDEPATRWIGENLTHGARLGFDPWLHTAAAADRLRTACTKAGAELVPCTDNPVDAIWENQPGIPVGAVVPHPLSYAGEDHEEKLARIAEKLEADDVDAAILTQPDSIAWLFNIRGQDVSHTPLPLAFALMHAKGHAELFIDERKLSSETRKHLGNKVTLHAPGRLKEALDELGAAKREIRLDITSAADWIKQRLDSAGAIIKPGDDPCLLPKARKNDIEIEGMRTAHRRDGAAVTRFLAWLSREATSGTQSEISAAQALEAFRAETGALKDLSFDTISGSGPNGAIVHYRVTQATNRTLGPGDIYLVDSGAQYLDGTTDITRTVAIGEPAQTNDLKDVRDRFTRVLKGHIGLAMARFPKGTSGSQLDVLARNALWQAGLDFDHGTGHGVGSYLSVHEGPQRISKLPHNVSLDPGMVISNEPGFYKTGCYGIRIENLVAVTPPTDIDGGERPMMAFETLTLAPIDRTLIDPTLMDATERAWLNTYHARVLTELAPLLPPEDQAWLEQATRAL
ncbi:aminopeptidase P family protein [Pyruvatibacter sp.]|uniref:aminopeptidase P family protein n=1 Tax=Pyruvatibacter sp. TaxID=1981328 RepID=UPI0032EBC91C